ncbi:MAG: cell division protein FtsL [Ruminiclostridium sp.]|nr:cell division protein FtsL [Ruminiclostridium sp.]
MYSYNRTSSAYDFSQFDTALDTVPQKAKKPKPVPRSEDSIKVHKTAVARSGAWVKTAIFMVVVVAVALFYVSTKAKISELSSEISTSSSALDEAQRENIRLQTELGNMVTLSKVDELATSSLGLQKTAKSQVKYITVHDKTMVQSAGKETNIFAQLKEWADDTAEFLGF